MKSEPDPIWTHPDNEYRIYRQNYRNRRYYGWQKFITHHNMQRWENVGAVPHYIFTSLLEDHARGLVSL